MLDRKVNVARRLLELGCPHPQVVQMRIHADPILPGPTAPAITSAALADRDFWLDEHCAYLVPQLHA